jgi:hypothetical protein
VAQENKVYITGKLTRKNSKKGQEMEWYSLSMHIRHQFCAKHRVGAGHRVGTTWTSRTCPGRHRGQGQVCQEPFHEATSKILLSTSLSHSCHWCFKKLSRELSGGCPHSLAWSSHTPLAKRGMDGKLSPHIIALWFPCKLPSSTFKDVY